MPVGDPSPGMSEELTFRRVGRNEGEAWDAIEGIVLEAFDASEYRPIAEFRPLFGEEAHPAKLDQPSVFGCFVGKELIAFACTELFPAQRVGYLWYMATSSRWRGRGVGTALLEYVQSIVTQVADEGAGEVVGLVAECEAPESADPSSIDVRRIHFYRSCGFRIEPVAFMAPPFARGIREPSPYRLLTWIAPGVDSSLDIGAVIDWICEGSTLNVPSEIAQECARFSRPTIGREPGFAPDMRARWEAFVTGDAERPGFR